MWPNPQELRVCGDKVSLISSFNIVASRVTKTFRPMSATISNFLEIPRNTVVKRGFSDVGDHVLMPDHPLRKDPAKLAQYLQSNMDTPRVKWFYQTYSRHLVELGELRVFFVGCRPVYTVWTKKARNNPDNAWEFKMVQDFYLLSKLGQVFYNSFISKY